MGKIWVFGDDINTDALAPGKYMNAPLEQQVRYCLEHEDAEFAQHVKPGDMILAGANFGVGSSREQAAEILKYLGIERVLAKSFGGIFFRNAINLGLRVQPYQWVSQINPTAVHRTDVWVNELQHLIHAEHGHLADLKPLPDFMNDMLRHGGLIPHLLHKNTRR